MSIGFQTSIAGGKTTTSGTTFTLALSSTAGDLIVVAIALATTTGSVSSITDTGGNTYHKVGSLVSGSGTVTTELWKTDAVKPAASGTLTVTVSGTGFRAQGVAASYRGVAYAGNPSATSTAFSTDSGTTSPITTGSITLKETNSVVVMAGGLAANNTFTAQNGNLRRQSAGTTSLRAVLIDSQTDASPITNSATMTAAAWTTVSLELRLLEVTQLESITLTDNFSDALIPSIILSDTLVLSDQLDFLLRGGAMKYVVADTNRNLTDKDPTITQNELGVAIGCPHLGDNWLDNFEFVLQPSLIFKTDALSMSDSLSSFLTVELDIITSDTMTLSDNLDNVLLGIAEALSDQLVFSDQSPTITGEYDLVIICPEFGALWSDAATETLIGAGGLAENLSDTLTMSDALGLGYGEGMVEQISFSDKTGVGYGFLIADQLVLSDSEILVLGFLELVSDSLSLTEALAIGYGNSVVDSLSMTDSLLVGYGNSIKDQLILAEGFFIEELGGSFTYELIVGGVIVVATGTVGNESIQLTDSLLVGYGDSVTDSFTLLDAESLAIVLQFGFTETLTITDASSLGYGFSISETLSLSDFLRIGYGDQITDTLALSDSLTVGFPSLAETLTDQLTIGDSVLLGYGDQIVDPLSMSEQLVLGYGDQITDTLTIVDSAIPVLGLTKSFSDTETLVDVLAIGYGNAEVEQLSFSDANSLGYGLQVVEDLALSESLLIGYGDLISDQMTLTDAFVFSGAAGLQEILSDTMALSDVLAIGYGDVVSEQLVLQDQSPTIIGEYDIAIGTSGSASWSDAANLLEVLLESLSDTLSLTDSIIVFGGASPLTEILSDTMTLQDKQPTIIGEIDLALACPHLNNWQDSFQKLGQATKIFSETLVMADFFKGIPPTLGELNDQLVLSDNTTGIGYGNSLTDSLNFSEQFSFIESGGQIANLLSDVLTLIDSVSIFVTIPIFADQMVLLDALAFNLAQATIINETLVDTLTQTDRIRVGYGDQLADQLSMTDSVTEFLSTSNLPEIFSDDLILLEQLGICYGNLVADSSQIPQQLAQDSFIRPNQNPVNTNWIAAGSDPLPQIISNELVLSSLITFDVALYKGISWPADQYSQITLQQLKPGAGYVGLVLRCDSIGNNLYYIDLDAQVGFGGIGVSTPLNLQKILGGVPQGPPYHTFGFIVPQIGDIFRAQILGTEISVYQNGVLLGSFVDNSLPILSGSAGLFLQSGSGTIAVTDVALNNWVGGLIEPMVESLGIGYGLLPVELQVLVEELGQDNFTRPNENPINPAAWQTVSTIPALQIVSDHCESTVVGGTGAGENYIGVSWQNDQAVDLTLGSSSVGGSFSILLRSGFDLGTGNVFGYAFNFIDNGDGTCQLSIDQNLASGGVVNFWQSLKIMFTDGDVFRALVFGEVLAFYQNGVLLGWTDDATYLAGNVGLYLLAPAAITDIQISDFKAGLPLPVLTEQLVLGYGSALIDALSLTDLVLIGKEHEFLLIDTLLELEFVSLGYGDLIVDQLVLIDAISLSQIPQPNIQLTDQLVLSDQIRIGDGLFINESLTLFDNLVLQQLGVVIAIFPTDQLVMLDLLNRIAYGDQISDVLTLVEAPVLGFGLLLKDQMIGQTDQIGVGPGVVLSDQITAQLDQIVLVEGLVELIADASPVQLDALAGLFTYALQTNDHLVFQEQLRLLYGLIVTGDSLVMVDQVTPSLQTLIALALADSNFANWLDQVLTLFVYAPTEITLHSLVILLELVANLQTLGEIEVASLTVESQVEIQEEIV